MSTAELHPELFSAPREQMWSALDFVDSLPHLDIDDLPGNDRRCPHCWNDFGQEFEEEIDEKKDWRRILRDFKELPFCRSTPCNDPVRLPCSHVFGLTCLVDIFMKMGSRCPMCRTDHEVHAQRELNRIFHECLSPRDIREKSWPELRLCFSKLVVVPGCLKAEWEQHWEDEVLRKPKPFPGESVRSLHAQTEAVKRIVFKTFDKYACRFPGEYTACTAALVTQMTDYAEAKARSDGSITMGAIYFLHHAILALCRTHASLQTWQTVHEYVDNVYLQRDDEDDEESAGIVSMLQQRYGPHLDQLFDSAALRTSRFQDHYLMLQYYVHSEKNRWHKGNQYIRSFRETLTQRRKCKQVYAMGAEESEQFVKLMVESMKKNGSDFGYGKHFYLFSTVASDCAVGNERMAAKRVEQQFQGWSQPPAQDVAEVFDANMEPPDPLSSSVQQMLPDDAAEANESHMGYNFLVWLLGY